MTPAGTGELEPLSVTVSEVVRPNGTPQYTWLPFPDTHAPFTVGWWDDAWRFHHPGKRRWFQATAVGVEVGRVEIESGDGDDYYVGREILGEDPILGIEFIDVAETHRRRGVGTAIVRQLEDRFRGHRLVAFSEDADVFWRSLGWIRIEHPEGAELYRPLFVQPV